MSTRTLERGHKVTFSLYLEPKATAASCLICWDPLLPLGEKGNEELIASHSFSLKSEPHSFHYSCLQRWFDELSKAQKHMNTPVLLACPACQISAQIDGSLSAKTLTQYIRDHLLPKTLKSAILPAVTMLVKKIATSLFYLMIASSSIMTAIHQAQTLRVYDLTNRQNLWHFPILRCSYNPEYFKPACIFEDFADLVPIFRIHIYFFLLFGVMENYEKIATTIKSLTSEIETNTTQQLFELNTRAKELKNSVTELFKFLGYIIGVELFIFLFSTNRPLSDYIELFKDFKNLIFS